MIKNINNNAPVKCNKEILINASTKKVWGILSNIDQWANWQADISKSKLKGELKTNATFDWRSGGVKIHSMLHTVEPNSKLGWIGKSLGVLAIHNWKISEQNGLTKVEVEESMEGVFAWLFKKPFIKKLEKGMQTWLDLLKAESEKEISIKPVKVKSSNEQYKKQYEINK